MHYSFHGAKPLAVHMYPPTDALHRCDGFYLAPHLWHEVLQQLSSNMVLQSEARHVKLHPGPACDVCLPFMQSHA